MKIRISSLHSRVGWRIFTLFIISALVPTILTLTLSLQHVSKQLLEQAQDQLSHKAKSYGMEILDRLVVASTSLSNIAFRIRTKELSPEGLKREHTEYFSSIGLIEKSQQTVSVLGRFEWTPKLSNQAAKHLHEGNTFLFQVTRPTESHFVFIAQLLDSGNPNSNIIVAELNNNYLWAPQNNSYSITDFCVFNIDRIMLYCTQPIPQKVVDKLEFQRHGLSTNIVWDDDTETFVTGYWELFLTGRFKSPSWILLASQPQSVVNMPLAGFKQIFISAIMFTLLIVMLMSVTQIRRILIPLEKLTAATRRISKKDFYNEVQVLSRDEFGQLAGSFNAMSRELAKQFNAITALSRVDRVILTTIDVSQVIEMIMHYMPKTISCNQISITVIDKTVKNMACTYTQVNGNKDTQVKRHPLKIDQSKTLLENPNGIWTDHDEGFSSLLIPLEPSKVQSVFMLPVITQAYLVGIIALGFESIQAADEDNLIQARSFADRLAVALATAEREEKLYKRANFDALTGLPNRQLLKDRLSHELAHAKRDGNRLAMLFLDLDRFKNVNDSLGHSVGDLLLINVAQRLKQCIQESDTIARFGGDEFIIVLSKIDSVEDVVVITEQISNVLSTPMRLDGKDHFVSTSIGIAIFPDNGTTSEELLRNADTAMYRAKNSGQGKYAFFEKRMNAAMLERISLESDLHHALARNELFLVFQPQINLHTERVSGAEVLIRWRHPNKGLVAPNRFLPIAEDTGIIVPIGNWVLREACRQLLIWEKAGIRINHLAVNVSVLQFRETNFLDTIHHLLDQFKISPERLELEITESLLMDDIENVSAVLHLLKTLGIRIAIDDFGTGYSSLKYLQKLPIDTLKVDQSFTRNLTRNASSVVLTKAMIAMARSMNMETVVEGVETEEQLNILQDQNCDSVQGFFFSQPLETKAFVNFVRTQNARNRKLTSFPRQSSA